MAITKIGRELSDWGIDAGIATGALGTAAGLNHYYSKNHPKELEAIRNNIGIQARADLDKIYNKRNSELLDLKNKLDPLEKRIDRVKKFTNSILNGDRVINFTKLRNRINYNGSGLNKDLALDDLNIKNEISKGLQERLSELNYNKTVASLNKNNTELEAINAEINRLNEEYPKNINNYHNKDRIRLNTLSKDSRDIIGKHYINTRDKIIERLENKINSLPTVESISAKYEPEISKIKDFYTAKQNTEIAKATEGLSSKLFRAKAIPLALGATAISGHALYDYLKNK